MMGMVFGLIFSIPLILFCFWWLWSFLLIILFFIYIHSFWFMSYYSMISYFVGGDLLSMGLIFLSFWIIILMIIASFLVYKDKLNSSEFLLINLFLLLFLILSFSVMNILLFYIFFESSLIPTLFLIFGWGYQPERLKAGMYLLFYTLFGSMPLLLCIFMISGVSMTLFYFLIELNYNVYIYFSLIVAFLISLPMIFVHFWLPKAHVEAPISGSMILAGVLLKLGGYGMLRVMLFMYNYSIRYNYIWISISMWGFLVVGILCLFQVDIKSLIAYSSVAHMGLVLCGIMTLNYWGLCGSLIMMIGHGLCSSGLFSLANVLYEKSHSRSFLVNKGMLCFMPSLSLFWFILSVNNMASPVSLNLLGEIMLINSMMSWSGFSFLFLCLLSFLSCCYMIYLYSYVQHGSYYSGTSMLGNIVFREYMLVFFHLLPLNIVVVKSDIFVMWL